MISLKKSCFPFAVLLNIKFQRLSEVNGFYTLKTTVTSAENSKGTEFLSSMKAKAFLDSGLSDTVSTWILPNGAVTAVSFQVTNSSQPLVQGTSEYKLNSNFYLRTIDQAPV